MMYSIKPISLAISSILLSSSLLSVNAFANNNDVADNNVDSIDDIEVITITNQRHHLGIDNNESYAHSCWKYFKEIKSKEIK